MSTTEQMDRLEHLAERYHYRIDSRDACWLTGLVSTGPFDGAHERITALWQELAMRYREIGLRDEPVEWLSPCHGRETEFTCYLGLTSDDPVSEVPDGMVAIELRPHEYAVASFRGSQEELMAVYQDLDEWIVTQGRERNDAVLWLESYPRPYKQSQPNLELDIWLPLR